MFSGYRMFDPVRIIKIYKDLQGVYQGERKLRPGAGFRRVPA